MGKRHLVALVTGATSGIGLATSNALVQAGYAVYGTTRRHAPEPTGDVSLITCDVRSEESVADAVGFVLDRADQIDLLVNNAGVGLLGAVEDSSVAQHQELFDLNVFGAIRTCKAVLPSMRRRGSGRIVNISSVLGFIPAPFSAAYAASKHALEAYSQSLDHEVRGQGVRVVLVEPAYTRTSFDANMLKPDHPKDEYLKARAGADKLIEQAIAKADTPEAVAKVVIRAATARSPALRYQAGGLARSLEVARKLVPEKMLDGMLRKQMQLDRTGT
ncbi:SDR family NAD(P)-dependent oxidoreductase [Rhizobium deserti]|uniref:SDR family NAD(P)-dependent oxidoreductase n=1 Tax=Rhizobium deserti TaxID=2547961 RepID=A0A4R5UN67_9HYPH|nr:oxidoreductase [Rhizobium deserti]TDK39239.1 SDR family NAD(P)-dependent oxidoreductase [Rhizobium deserti]